MGSNLRQAACVGAGVWVMDDGFLYIFFFWFFFVQPWLCLHTHKMSQWRLGASYQGDGSMRLEASAGIMCLFTWVQPGSSRAARQTDPSTPSLSFHN